jgi:hypothetical protein
MIANNIMFEQAAVKRQDVPTGMFGI